MEQKNSLGVEVTRPNDVLVIMRGVPGSGKSTAAKKLVGNGVIHSTDEVIESKFDYFDYFKKMKESGDWSMHSKMHYENFLNAKKSIDAGISPVIIDNTNIKASEPKKYVEYALEQGYADDNIEFFEIGTAGLSAEELAERNTHGVPLETIEKMIQSMNSVGPLTLEKVLGAKSMDKKPKKFASVVLDEASRSKLFVALKHHIPAEWKVYIHHMTINFGKGLGPDREEDLGKKVGLVVTDIGKSDMAIAVKVHGYPSDNDIPHITLAVNPNGGKPVMSNDITNWEKLDTHINVSGVVTQEKLK